MPSLPLTLATCDYDHVRDLVDGSVPVTGVDLNHLTLPLEDIFTRFSRYREWDVSEHSLAKYCSLRAAGDDSLIAIPVFLSRLFRHSAIFVTADGPIRRPEDLAGRTIGIPEWRQTATVYIRGLLEHDYGVGLRDVEWVQGGVDEPGRVESIPIEVPEGVRYRTAPDEALNDLLLAGRIDAVITAHPPQAFEDQSGRVVRLIADFVDVERSYFERTGVFPIMHVMVLKREVYDQNRWLAKNLLEAFDEAKNRSMRRVLSANPPHVPLPWGSAEAERTRDLLGQDFWPYGIEPNRPTLEAFLQYAREQGLLKREIAIDELFAAETSDRRA